MQQSSNPRWTSDGSYVVGSVVIGYVIEIDHYWNASLNLTHARMEKIETQFKARAWVATEWSKFLITNAKHARVQRNMMIREYRDVYSLEWSDIAARTGVSPSGAHKIYWTMRGMHGKLRELRGSDADA